MPSSPPATVHNSKFDRLQCLCDDDFKCFVHANAANNVMPITGGGGGVDFGPTITTSGNVVNTTGVDSIVKNPFTSGAGASGAAVTGAVGGGGGILRRGPVVSTGGTGDPQSSLSFPPYHPFYSKAASYHYGKEQHLKEFTDIRQMESTLYKLLAEFHLGHLHAFGEGVTFENMIKVREQQENLARLHFELNLQQSNKHSFEHDFFNDPSNNSSGVMNTVMSKPFSKSNMLKLIQNLQSLCKSIERLQWKNSHELEFN